MHWHKIVKENEKNKEKRNEGNEMKVKMKDELKKMKEIKIIHRILNIYCKMIRFP